MITRERIVAPALSVFNLRHDQLFWIAKIMQMIASMYDLSTCRSISVILLDQYA